MQNDHGGAIPDTVEAITPSGGRHIVFKYPAGVTDYGLTMETDIAKMLTKWLSSLEADNLVNIPTTLGVSKFGWRNKNTEFICPGMNSKNKKLTIRMSVFCRVSVLMV